MKQVFLKIRGRVQGVFFRESTKDQAERLGLTGWVKNMPDGTVELLAQGDEIALTKLQKWCINGPSGAQVERVEEEWKDIEKSAFESFEIEY